MSERISGATGLPVGISAQVRRFFDMSQDPRFVREHNERLARQWDKSKPDHSQLVYSLFDVTVSINGQYVTNKPFQGRDSLALHHQYYFQAEKELEYWALKFLGRAVSASFYVRHYIGDGKEWVFIERKTISLSPPRNGAEASDLKPAPHNEGKDGNA